MGNRQNGLEPFSSRYFRLSEEPPTPPRDSTVRCKLPHIRSRSHQEVQALHTILCPHFACKKARITKVEPRGVEPLISTVQRRSHNVVVVRCVQKCLQMSVFSRI